MLKDFFKKIGPWQALLVVALLGGLALRLYGLGGSGIFFYDEALYLNHSLPAFDLLGRQHFSGLSETLKALAFYLHWPLNFTKPIWILLIDSRYFLTHVNDWDYAKYVACFFGIMTLPLLFVFVRRFFDSRAMACLAVAILALLPGHVFYSRLGLQESFSIFVVLAGFYFYLFSRDSWPRLLLAGLFFSMAYLANYRLIILPGLLILTELWLGLLVKEGIRWRHLVWTCVMFLAVMVLVGALFGGVQFRYTFAWVFHQQDMAVSKRLWSEILAYPYYIFRLENVLLGFAFFSSVYFLVRRQWKYAWPFIIVCAQMLFFTTATDRGLRYIAVVLPFMAMASAALIMAVYQDIRHDAKKQILAVFLMLMFGGMIIRSIALVTDVSAYELAVRYLTDKDPDVKIVSCQDLVQRLYFKDRRNVRPVAEDVMILLKDYAEGYRYLVLDPQAYIYFSGNDHKWGLPLKGYVGFVERMITPVKTFAHFNRAVMERVVFEHSDDLLQSIRFLDSPELARMSSLRIYDMRTVVPALSAVLKNARQRTR